MCWVRYDHEGFMRVVLHMWPKVVRENWFRVSHGNGRQSNVMPLKVSKCVTSTVVTYGALHVPSEIQSLRFDKGCFAQVIKSREEEYDLGFLVVTISNPNTMPLKVSKCVMWTVVTYKALHVQSQIWSLKFCEGCLAYMTKSYERKLVRVSRGHGRRSNAMPLKVSKCVMWTLVTHVISNVQN